MSPLLTTAQMVELKRLPNGSQHFVEPGDTLAESFLKQGHRRVLCTINDSHTLHAAIQRRKTGEYYIHIGNTTLKKLKLRSGQVLKLSIVPDLSELQFEMPQELQAVLDTDEKAQHVFNSLSKGTQRSLVYLVTLLKTTSKRIERALLIAEKLKSGVTQARLILKK